MSYKSSSNARDKSKERIDSNATLGKTKLSQTSTTDSSKYPPIKRDSIKNSVPIQLPSKNKLKEQDLMTESKIIQAKNGLQLLKKKMSQKGMLPTKSETQYKQQSYQEEVENVGQANLPPKSNKTLLSEKQIRPKFERQPAKKRTVEINYSQQPQYTNPTMEAPIQPKNKNFQKMLQEQLKKEQIHSSVVSKVSQIKSPKNNAQPSQYQQNVQLYECSQGCGRKFKQETLEKHEKVCQKVFQQKRKAFDSAGQRKLEEQGKTFGKAKPLTSKVSNQMKQTNKPKAGKQAMPKWKLQSLQLRASLKVATNQQLTKQQAQINQIEKEAMIQCNYCGRRFNKEAGKRHIAFCQQQSKKMGNKLNSTQNIKKKW